MPVVLVIVICAGIVFWVNARLSRERSLQEVIDCRKSYVESLGPNTHIIVNNGVHLFFMNDEQRFFGLAEDGKKYSFEGLQNVSRYDGGISFFHDDSVDLCVGLDYSHRDTTVPLDETSIGLIYMRMMVVLKNNLHKLLEENGIHSTHEYYIDGTIWGCDVNSKHFYCVSGCPMIYRFSDLIKVTVEDLRSNTLYDGSYIIHVYVKDDSPGFHDWEYQIHIKTPDETYFGLLAMFKGIRNRQSF